MTKKTWYGYFKEAMNGAGLPVPESLFTTSATALSTIKGIEGAIALGGDITIGELIGAGFLADGLAVAGGVLASAYVGACIGAVIAASASVGWDWASELASADIAYDNIDAEAFAELGNANFRSDGGIVAEADEGGVGPDAPKEGEDNVVAEADEGDVGPNAPKEGEDDVVAEAGEGDVGPDAPKEGEDDAVADPIG